MSFFPRLLSARLSEAATPRHGDTTRSSAELQAAVAACACGQLRLSLQRSESVGVSQAKRLETVVASFATRWIKTPGYRISPPELEEVQYANRRVGDASPLVLTNRHWDRPSRSSSPRRLGPTAWTWAALLADCLKRTPEYVVPAGVEAASGPLPRNPSGKIDRKLLSTAFVQRSL